MGVTMDIMDTMATWDCTITMGRDQQTRNHQLLPNRPTFITMATTHTMDIITDTTDITMVRGLLMLSHPTSMDTTTMDSDQLMPRHPTSTTTDTTHTTTGTITDTTVTTTVNDQLSRPHLMDITMGTITATMDTITDTTTDTIRNKFQNDFHSIFLFQGAGYLTKSY